MKPIDSPDWVDALRAENARLIAQTEDLEAKWLAEQKINLELEAEYEDQSKRLAALKQLQDGWSEANIMFRCPKCGSKQDVKIDRGHTTPAWMREFIDGVDRLAFAMQPPNVYTPQFALLCIEAKRRLGETT